MNYEVYELYDRSNKIGSLVYEIDETGKTIRILNITRLELRQKKYPELSTEQVNELEKFASSIRNGEDKLKQLITKLGL